MTLPTAKTPPNLDPLASKILIYGQQKIGKSTLAASLDPEHTLFLATEPGLGHLEVFQQPVRTWGEFRAAGTELAKGEHDFKLLVVDTVDELARFCTEHVLEGLAPNAKLDQYLHPSDFDYGKGWDAATQEFRLRIGKLCNLGLGVIFISHAKHGLVKTRTGLEIPKISPDVGHKGQRTWLLGFVDFIFFAGITVDADGQEWRVLRTQPTESVEAGGRVPRDGALPELIPMDGVPFRAALERIVSPVAA